MYAPAWCKHDMLSSNTRLLSVSRTSNVEFSKCETWLQAYK